MVNVAVIGARRARQGTGRYFAAAFAKLGHRVCAITATADASLREATDALRRDGVRLQDGSAYTCARAMLAEATPDALVIASPADSHLEYIRMGLEHRCHVLCEKPLFAPAAAPATPADDAKTCADLMRRFAAARRCLAVNTQWPQTLPTFMRLHPQLNLSADAIDTFDMRLCPESTGVDMLLDAAPHFLSMLYALCGAGAITAPTIDMSERELRLQCTLRHARGQARARLTLEHRRGQPKPAEYAINGAIARRHIQMPGYLLSLEDANGARIPMRDPLRMIAEDFIRQIETEAHPDDSIRICMQQLSELLAQAAQQPRVPH